MPLPYLFSLIFLVVSVMFFFYGVFILTLNTKSTMYRIFFVGCLSLFLWSFSLSISNSAQDYETCLFWRRIGAFGWGPFFSFLLHFIILLTEKVEVFKKKWIYILIYLPAAVNIFVYGIYSKIAVGTFKLVNTYAGWVNISYHTFWDWFYNFYYIGFSLTGIALILHWGMLSKKKENKKQVYMISTSFFLAILIGTMSEFVINAVFPFKMPQIAPLVILAPISVMFYCIKRYGFIVKESKSETVDISGILSGESREKLYLNYSLTYVLGGFVSFAALYFSNRGSLESALIFGATMASIGLILQIIQKIKIKLNYKDMLSNVIMAISIPVIIVNNYDYSPFYAGIIPIIFIISSIAFSQRRMLVLNVTTTSLTLIYLWIKAPVVTVIFTSTDHVLRIFILTGILSMAFYINHIYTQRILENEEKLGLQKLLSRISSIFINTNDSNLDDRINEVLKLCGEHYKTDHIYVLVFSNGQKDMKFYEWCPDNMESGSDFDKGSNAASISEWINMERLVQQESICISDVAATSEEGLEKEYMKEKDIKSIIINPLRNQDRVIGLMVFETVKNTMKFKEYQKETLKVLAHLISDIVLRVDAEKEINYRANFDALTGLPNRAMFMNQLRSAISMAERAEKLVGVAFVDIDSFKYINDTLGHVGGDSLLLKIGERISSCLRLYDIVARFGGDEFVIMIPQASHVEDICTVAAKITDSFKQPLTANNQEFFITISMGVSVFPLDGTEAEDLVKSADAAMYVSKENGKNKYTMCSSFLQEKIEVNASLTNSLHLAIQRKEFLLYYQPQVNTTTGEIVGVEALIRWNHPQKGIISPAVFIPLAEKNGLINHLGEWVLQEACVQNKVWKKMGLKPIRMAVNLSLGQFLNPNLAGTVESIIKKTELDPTFLELEITESIATYDADYIISTLNKLKALGVTISIDDFGTEYSSLSRLKIMPVDKIKIDMRFIQGIYRGSKDESIIKVMLQLGRTFGLKVLAEGVENEQQLSFLKENLCDEIQGYYFYKPMTAEELEPILKHTKS